MPPKAIRIIAAIVFARLGRRRSGLADSTGFRPTRPKARLNRLLTAYRATSRRLRSGCSALGKAPRSPRYNTPSRYGFYLLHADYRSARLVRVAAEPVLIAEGRLLSASDRAAASLRPRSRLAASRSSDGAERHRLLPMRNGQQGEATVTQSFTSFGLSAQQQDISGAAPLAADMRR
jgi:hypothetical protein